MEPVHELSGLELARYMVNNISQSGLTIYDEIEVGDPELYIPSAELELFLNNTLIGIDLGDLPNRTRSKVIKQLVCEKLGYPVPDSFSKTRPRFPGQNFNVHLLKANNLQIWNEEIIPSRRYVLVKTNEGNEITRVKVISGDMLAALDTTGTLTQKYQARLTPSELDCELISSQDTELLNSLLGVTVEIEGYGVNSFPVSLNPTDYPTSENLLPIHSIYSRLQSLIGREFFVGSRDQERITGSLLHASVCDALGYSSYKDDGRFPDVKNQLLEVKLQTSPTIDLGLFRPDDTSFLDVPQINETSIRLCDVRYALFYGYFISDQTLCLTNFYLTTGEDFFSRFPQFQGNVVNAKLQINLSNNFFD